MIAASHGIAADLTVEGAGTLTEETRAAWRRMAASAPPFLDLPWFEAAPLPGSLSLYVARLQGTVVGLLPTFWLQEPPAHPYHDPRVALLGSGDSPWRRPEPAYIDAANARWFPSALTTSPYGYRTSTLIDPASDTASVLGALIEEANRDLAKRGARSFVHYGLYDEDTAYLRLLQARQQVLVLVGTHCELAVPSSLDGYFRALGPRGRRLRSRYRQAILEPGAEWITVSAPSGESFDAVLREAAITLFGARARAHGDVEPPNQLYVRVLGPYPERRWLLACRSRGEVRSAVFVFQRDGILYPKFFGSTVRFDYFTLVFPQLVRLAVELDCNRIALGGGSHEAKLLRGATLRRLYAAVECFDSRLEECAASALATAGRDRAAYFAALSDRFHRNPPAS